MNCFAQYAVRARFAAALFSVLTLTIASRAQSQVTLVQVDVPFAFENGSRHLEAGTYRVRIDSDHMFTLTGNGQTVKSMGIPDETISPLSTTAVVFRRYGDRYFLREVRVKGKTTYAHCVVSKREKEERIASRGAVASGTLVALAAQPRP